MKIKNNNITKRVEVKKVKPIFYKLCVSCNREFKENYGWKYEIGGCDFQTYSRYICCDCAKTEEEAEQIRKLKSIAFN